MKEADSRPLPLTRIVPWGQQLACEVLRPGDLAVDLTAGKGRDTLVLAEAVGPSGQVLAMDIQSSALEQTEVFLRANGHGSRLCLEPGELSSAPGVALVQACHSRLAEFVERPCRAIMANLGYLPGGDHSLITHCDTTLAALSQSLGLLSPGGRLVVTAYPAHAGGEAESRAVTKLFSSLPETTWRVLQLSVANSAAAPVLLIAESREKQTQA